MAIVALDSNSVRTSPDDWRAIVKSAIRDPNELRRRLGLPLESEPQRVLDVQQADQQFRTFVPEPFLSRIQSGNPADPLLLQVLPVANEARDVAGFTADAVGDAAAEKGAGLIHKYQGRALLITRGVCAVNCRYCFRRHYPYDSAPVSIQQFERTLQVVRDDESIEELILSGGDPLMMVDKQLQQLLKLIESIPHIRRLRIHSRLPIVIPQRVNSALMSMLSESPLTVVVVVHVNHPNEIDQDVANAMAALHECRLTLLNQSVLLKGVNDDLPTLVELSKRLIDQNCLPYYLHQLDRVQGAAHFEVDVEVGKALVAEMQKQLPGYAVPKYVQEIAGEASKTIL